MYEVKKYILVNMSDDVREHKLNKNLLQENFIL